MAAIGAMVLLALFLWECFARSFSGSAIGARIRGSVIQDASRNDDLRRTLSELPTLDPPRILLFGSSQTDAVKDDEELSQRAIPFRISAHLAPQYPRHTIVDLSGPGQQVTESEAILLSTIKRLEPSVVVLNVGLFSMTGTDIRPALRNELDFSQIAQTVNAIPSSQVDGQTKALAIAGLRLQDVGKSDSTAQARVDARLDRLFASHLSMVANRRAIYNALIDQPLRRDAIRFLQRRRGNVRTARSYEVAPAYAPSLAAIELIGATLRAAGIPFVICILPFEQTRSPAPYSPETKARVRRDLEALATRQRAILLDLTDSLNVTDFGVYDDGSPDGLHFRANGHEVVGRALARTLRTLPLGP